jgi:hypothetical protein
MVRVKSTPAISRLVWLIAIGHRDSEMAMGLVVQKTLRTRRALKPRFDSVS